MGDINAYVKGENRQLKESLNIKNNLEDLNLFTLTKRQVLEEDIFGHFYPFCMINCTLSTMFLLRKTSWKFIGLGAFLMVEYIYFLFNFPVEAWHFHRRALSTNKAYAQMIRDSYIAKFPESGKARLYRELNEKEKTKYIQLRQKLKLWTIIVKSTMTVKNEEKKPLKNKTFEVNLKLKRVS